MIIHNITRITTELLNVDDDGNVIDRKTGQQDISILKADEFAKAFEQIIKFKADWEEQCQAPSG